MCFIRELEHGVDGQLLRPADVTEAVHGAAVAALFRCHHQKVRIPFAQVVWNVTSGVERVVQTIYEKELYSDLVDISE